jgi:hypothetical protein
MELHNRMQGLWERYTGGLNKRLVTSHRILYELAKELYDRGGLSQEELDWLDTISDQKRALPDQADETGSPPETIDSLDPVP